MAVSITNVGRDRPLERNSTMKRTATRFANVRQIVTACAIAGLTALFAGQSTPAHAYEEDTHYLVTFVTCRYLGFTDAEATTVARYDQGMDDSDGTVAVTGITPHIRAEYLWHAIPLPTGINYYNVLDDLNRKYELWSDVLNQPTRERQLQFLGVFLHYQQDTWAHRHHENSSYSDFVPFTAPDGHATWGHQPDRPPFDPVCAVRSLEDSINYLRAFMTQVLGRQPNAVFNNYTPANVAKDSSWSEKGRVFNEVTVDNSTWAHWFVSGLIRAQISAYSSSWDPLYFAWTADEVGYSSVRSKFLAMFQTGNISISIPTARVPLTTLTTDGLLSEE
jgi:hypothetical protein